MFLTMNSQDIKEIFKPSPRVETPVKRNNYTPGPWTVDSDNVKAYIVSETGYRIANITLGTSIDRDFTLENANLIAAAPDLLNACEACLLREDILDSELGNILKSAISKATLQ